MSLALIQETAKEVRRLAIAGSPLAVGDFRLKKLIAPLEQAGAKVPVFAQVAKAISDVVNGKEADSAANLLSLSTLVNAILYTQGQTGSGSAAAIEELPAFSTSAGTVSTRTTARVLKPIIEALTTTGSGRFEIVRSAVERGAFNDLRLIEPALRALEDIYPELADLVAEKILPGYGPGIAPLLKQQLNLKGKKSDARRLLVLHRLDPAGGVELAKSALDAGTAEVKEAAIACLGKHEDCLPLVLEQAKAKNKALRAAALEALAEYDQPETTKLFTELIGGKALDLLAKPFRVIRNQQVLGALLAEGRRVFDLLLKGDETQIERYCEILNCFGPRKEPAVETLVHACFDQSDKVSKLKAPKNSVLAGVEVTTRLVAVLYGFGSTKSLEALLAKRDVLPAGAFHLVLRAALRAWTPARMFEEFNPLLGQKKGAGKDKADQLQRIIWLSCHDARLDDLFDLDAEDSEGDQALKSVTWDPRWLDAVIKADQFESACGLARPGHPGAVHYFLKRAEAKNPVDTGEIIEALAKCQHPKLTDVFLDLVKKKSKSGRYADYELAVLFSSVRHLPAGDLPKLDAFAATLDEKHVDRFLEALGPLRTAAQAVPVVNMVKTMLMATQLGATGTVQARTNRLTPHPACAAEVASAPRRLGPLPGAQHFPQQIEHLSRISTGFRPKAQGCRAAATLGSATLEGSEPQRGSGRMQMPGAAATPLGLWTTSRDKPRVGARASRQPWALSRNPVGIQRGIWVMFSPSPSFDHPPGSILSLLP